MTKTTATHLLRDRGPKKGAPRMALEKALNKATEPLTRSQLSKITGLPESVIRVILPALMARGFAYSDYGKPAKYSTQRPEKPKPPEVAMPRSINFWALPVYVPPPWPVRSDAGRVRA